eukprot:4610902-Lingulodinium_polyedra.AAC.1
MPALLIRRRNPPVRGYLRDGLARCTSSHLHSLMMAMTVCTCFVMIAHIFDKSFSKIQAPFSERTF